MNCVDENHPLMKLVREAQDIGSMVNSAQPLDLAAFRAEVAKRVNERLAEQAKLGAMPEAVSAGWVSRVLSETRDSLHADLVREIAAEVAGEKTR